MAFLGFGRSLERVKGYRTFAVGEREQVTMQLRGSRVSLRFRCTRTQEIVTVELPLAKAKDVGRWLDGALAHVELKARITQDSLPKAGYDEYDASTSKVPQSLDGEG